VEKELRVSGSRHDAFAKLHIFGLQTLAYAFDIRRGKGDMVETPGVLVLLLGATTTIPSRGLRVPIRCTVATPPE
jgi:hypothetical protein